MAKVSAHAKRTDQKYMSLPEYRQLDCKKNICRRLKDSESLALDVLEDEEGLKARRRLVAQAKREGISPLEKLCRLDRLSRKK